MQVAIHAGARFTDGGGLLKLLKANTQTLIHNRAVFWGFRTYKHVFRPALGAVGSRPAANETKEKFQNLIPKNRDIARAILTSEMYLGERSSTILDGQLYPLAGKRIARMCELFPDFRVELFVGLRNPGSYIPKALVSLTEVEREQVLASTDLSCLNWLTMIEDLRDLAPDVAITLWSNEDSPLIQGDIVRALAALPEDVPLKREHALLSSLVSKAGQQEIRRLEEQGLPPNDPNIKNALATIFREHAVADEIEEEIELPGWNQDVVGAFTELYEQDLARLQTMTDIRFLKP